MPKELEGSTDPLAMLKSKAAQNLEGIGSVSIQDILAAFQDKDEKGQHTTVIEFKMDYWDPASQKVLWSRSKSVTMASGITTERAGGYTTLILQFDSGEHPDMARIWGILSDYGKDAASAAPEMPEIPVMSITAVPMCLGGKFGMVATDPVFWCLQPSQPFEHGCNQIRILYQPESVLFLRDDSFEPDELVAKVKSELASEKLAQEAKARKQAQDEEDKKQHEAALSDYLENGKYSKHTFGVSKKRHT